MSRWSVWKTIGSNIIPDKGRKHVLNKEPIETWPGSYGCGEGRQAAPESPFASHEDDKKTDGEDGENAEYIKQHGNSI